MDLLKLVALDKEDLEIVSAHLQDAVVKVGEIVWQPEDHRLVVGLNRFDWEAASAETPAWRRRRSALRFDRVRSFKSRNVTPADKDKVLNLLALDFAETDAPAGTVTMSFSGDVALRHRRRVRGIGSGRSRSGLDHHVLSVPRASRARKDRKRKSLSAMSTAC